MRIRLGELRFFVREALSASVEDAIDALPALDPPSPLFGPQVDPHDVVDITSVFRLPVRQRVYGLDKASLRMAVPAKVPASAIAPVQDYVFRSGVRRYAAKAPKELPLVVLDGGEYFAQDHTRIAAQIMNGKDPIDVRLLEHVGSGQYRRPRTP